jgi:antitoxin component of RelBE/YafQ-DinJ toxin-antitoxin module
MQTLNRDLNFRIDEATKGLLQKEADSRGLKIADIVREALREFIGSHDLTVKHQEAK